MSDKVLTQQDFKELPFSPSAQEAVLGHLICNEGLYNQVRLFMEPNWFSNIGHQAVFKYLKEYSDELGRFPNVESLKLYISLEAPDDANKLIGIVTSSVMVSHTVQIEPLENKLLNWLKARIYFEGLSQSQALFNRKKFDEAYEAIDQCSKDISKARIKSDTEMEWSNPLATFELQKLEYSKGLTFGLKCFDDLLLPEQTHGSLLPGDTTILLASTNVGKTTTMITVAAHNLRRRRDILFLFHEGRPLDIQLKIWCNLLGVSMSELLGLYKNEPARVDKMAQILQEHMTLVPVFKPGLCVEEVEEVINRRVKEHQDKYGRTYDLIVDDYPAKLSTKMASGGQLQMRNMYQYVYNYFVQIGLFHQIHILGAIQTNREGSKINANLKDAKDHRIIGLEDVHESFGTMQDVCNVISINRDGAAKAEERVTFGICKSRSSKTGWVVVCKSDYGHACTHGDHLGATYYEGDAPPDKNLEELLKKYNGKQVPVSEQIQQDF